MKFSLIFFVVVGLVIADEDEEIAVKVAVEALKIKAKYAKTPDFHAEATPWLYPIAPGFQKKEVPAPKRTTTRGCIDKRLVEFNWSWDSTNKRWDLTGTKYLRGEFNERKPAVPSPSTGNGRALPDRSDKRYR